MADFINAALDGEAMTLRLIILNGLLVSFVLVPCRESYALKLLLDEYIHRRSIPRHVSVSRYYNWLFET